MKLSRYQHSASVSYAFGATLVFELLNSHPELITRIFLRANLTSIGPQLTVLLNQLRQRHIDIIESTKVFNLLGAKDNCLLIAEFRKPSAPLQSDASHLVLVHPSDSGNLGTIMRSAAAFGYHNLAIITPAVDPFDPKTIRASMGAIFHLNLQQFTDFSSYDQRYNQSHANAATNVNTTADTIAQSRAYYAFMLDASAQTLAELKTAPQPHSLIFGNEATGLSAEFAQLATPIFIPQSSQVDSLNLSVAASIAIYHFSQIK